MPQTTETSDGTNTKETLESRKRIRWHHVIAIYIFGGIFCAGIYVAGQEYVVRSAMHVQPPMNSRITMGALRHDFGSVAPGAILRRQFTIENHGRTDFVLRRRDHDPSGNKTGNIVIPPGQSRKVEVTVRAPGRPGRMQEFVDWSTNDPDRPRIRFALHATINNTGASRHSEK